MNYSIGYMVGTWIGAFLLIALFSSVIERFAFRKMEPLRRAQYTVGSAFLMTATLAGFGFADGGPFAWEASLNHAPAAVAVFLWFYRGYKKAWSVAD